MAPRSWLLRIVMVAVLLGICHGYSIVGGVILTRSSMGKPRNVGPRRPMRHPLSRPPHALGHCCSSFAHGTVATPRIVLSCSAAGPVGSEDASAEQLRAMLELAISEERSLSPCHSAWHHPPPPLMLLMHYPCFLAASPLKDGSRYGDAAKLRDRLAAAGPPSPPTLVNLWCLSEGHGGGPSDQTKAVCKEFTRKRKAGEDAALEEAALGAKGVGIEVKDSRGDGHRRFVFNGGATTTVRETSFGDSGLGYSVWVSGVALSVWMAMNRESVAGKKVLELGSGVGVSGLTCALVGAESVVLSDFGKQNDGGGKAQVGVNKVVSEDVQPEGILDNLLYNVGVNSVRGTCEISRLDWHAPPSLIPEKKFDVVLGSEVIYYEEDAEALASTVIRRTAPGGKFLLMNKAFNKDEPRRGLDKVRHFAEHGSTHPAVLLCPSLRLASSSRVPCRFWSCWGLRGAWSART